MTVRVVHLLALWAATMLALAGPGTAAAAGFPVGSVCQASAAANETYAAVAHRPSRWRCDPGDWSIAAPRVFLRFDLRDRQGPAPAILTTRLTRFQEMELLSLGGEGQVASRIVSPAQIRPGTSDWSMTAALPRVAHPATALVVRIDQAHHMGMLTEARLGPALRDTPASLRYELLIAALCGMLCLPMLFDLAFFRVLRERFLIWHGLAVVAMMVQTLVTSGLINRFAALSINLLCVLSAVSWGLGIAGAAVFAACFLEADALDPRHRRLLRGSAWWIAGWTAFYLFADGPLRPAAPLLYLASFVPVMALFAWVMLVALRRGSRAVRFQIAAWVPIMAVGVVRVGSALGITDAPLEMQLEQHAALALEVIISAFGVADRFLAIRRQRDRLWARSRHLEDLAGRDPLTGLLNRRMIQERFAELHAQGFQALAAIDLDRFKQVNDRYGHSVGDRVLRAAALALAPDDDTLVVRMGGEEFLLLLRGPDAFTRAERRRQAITQRIAVEVPGLAGIVTASMGLVEQPAGSAMRADFETLYAHCDRLLYEAKHAGRNRTMRERMQGFAGGRRRRAA